MINWLQKHAAEQSHSTCIEFQGHVYSFSQTLALSEHLASIMIDRFRLRKNEIFAFCFYNSPGTIFCYLACWISGITALPMNPRFEFYEIRDVLMEFKPKILVVDLARIDHALHELALTTQTILIDYASLMEDLIAVHEEDVVLPPTEDLNSQTIHLTSGSEGRYKGCMHDLKQLTAYAEDRAEDMGYRNSDKMLIVLSLNHAFAFSFQLLPALVLGIPMIILPKFDEHAVMQAILETNATTICLLPTMAYILAETKEQYLMPKHFLRSAIIAGDSLPDSMNMTIHTAFGFYPMIGLGMTECYGYTLNREPEKYRGSVGLPLQNFHIRIAKNGEILVRGTGVMLEYWQNPPATKAALKNGWLHTGDLGYIDKNSRLWFKGRLKKVIVTGGSKISPGQVENALYDYPGVIEAAVIAQKDPILSEVPIAFVAMHEIGEVTEQKIKDFLVKKLADYKIPHRIIILSELPKISVGKIDYQRLENLLNGPEQNAA